MFSVNYASRRTKFQQRQVFKKYFATTFDEVRANKTKTITEEQREFYFKHGYLVLPGFLSGEWLEKLKKVTDEFIEISRNYTSETVLPLGNGKDEEDQLRDKFMLAEGHTAEFPMVTRLSSPSHVHETYWKYTYEISASIAEDVLGPNVRFHHSKLNFKWPKSFEQIHWHQDIQFWPHTNFTPLTVGVYLNDVSEDMGPMQIVPLSEYDELHALVDSENGAFTGILNDDDLARIPTHKAKTTEGVAGTITLHNARCVHSSLPNLSSNSRPLLLNTFASTSAGMLASGTNCIHLRSSIGCPVVRGEEEVYKIFDPRSIPVAPDFSSGYVSPFIKKASVKNLE